MKAQGRRLDYITRALRLEEMPVLRKKYDSQVYYTIEMPWVRNEMNM